MRRFGWFRFAFLLIVLSAIPLSTGWSRVSEAVLRDNFEVYTEYMSSPANLIVPIFSVLIGCIPLYRELGDRYIVNTRTRAPIRDYVVANTVVAVFATFVAFFVFAMLPFIVAFVVWPSIGNPFIDPGMYYMTSAEALRDVPSRVTFGDAFAVSPVLYAVAYSAWVGVGGALYAVVGITFLLLIPNRVLAITLPFVLYLLQTVGAALLGAPRFGLLYSLLPFGLTYAPMIEGAAATLVLMAAVVFAWSYLLPRMVHLDRLA